MKEGKFEFFFSIPPWKISRWFWICQLESSCVCAFISYWLHHVGLFIREDTSFFLAITAHRHFSLLLDLHEVATPGGVWLGMTYSSRKPVFHERVLYSQVQWRYALETPLKYPEIFLRMTQPDKTLVSKWRKFTYLLGRAMHLHYATDGTLEIWMDAKGFGGDREEWRTIVDWRRVSASQENRVCGLKY